jgi:hypothetical protein
MKRIKDYNQFLNEKFADQYPKDSWVNINITRVEFSDIIEDLIKNAYKNVPGGTLEDPKKTITDQDVDYWRANDVDEDPDADAVIFGKDSVYGVKLIGMGQDGTKKAKVEVIKKLQDDLSHLGFFTEISDNILNLIKSKEIPYINNKEEAEKILKKNIEWVGSVDGLDKDGWYYRNIHGHRKLKLLIGNPIGVSKDSLTK